MLPARSAVAALPKIDLHRHLDGAARPATLLDLARRCGHPLPADTIEGLLPHVRAGTDCRSLGEFLRRFEVFYPVLRHPGALGRVAFECLEDAAADAVVHVELRFCPALQADDRAGMQTVVEEVLAGLDAGERATGTTAGLILCCYRSQPVTVNEAIVDLALAFAGRGVVGVDLAGPEQLPGAPVAAALARAREGGLPVTVHAGEAAGPASVAEALDVLVATRIGHGVALKDDPALAQRVRDAGVALECCLTSNLQTGALASLDDHPLETLRAAGHAVTLNTDDPTVCGVSLTDELMLAARTFGYDLAALRQLNLAAADAAFLDAGARRALRARLSATAADQA